MEEAVHASLRNFKEQFEYDAYFISTKTKYTDCGFADRSARVEKHARIVSVSDTRADAMLTAYARSSCSLPGSTNGPFISLKSNVAKSVQSIEPYRCQRERENKLSSILSHEEFGILMTRENLSLHEELDHPNF